MKRTILAIQATLGLAVAAALAWLGWWLAALICVGATAVLFADTLAGRPVKRVDCYHVHHHGRHHR